MKIGLFLVVLAVVGCAFADDEDDEDCCSYEDGREIRHIWDDVWSSSFTDRRVAIVGAVFNDLFKHYPTSKALFERVKIDEPESGEFKSHLVRIANGLDLLINLLNDTLVLQSPLCHLADQHIQRKGVTKEYFRGIGEAFARVLPQVLSSFNVDAWNRCFHRLTARIAKDLP
nr:globin A2 [Lumbricus terrestris]